MAMSTGMADQGGQPKSQSDEAIEALERRKAKARRTAWIIAAIAIAFFISSLLQGHLAHIPR
ncbi:MAG: hypothetical protein ACREPS_04145 [Rhodanobacteraceae bacterium]